MDVLPDEAILLKLDKDSLYSIFKELNPKSVINLCNSSKQLRELCRRYNFWVFASGEFEKMDGDTLALIMKNMIPQEVVQFCSDPAFTRVCNRGSFWRNMLRFHYDITDVENPRQTYLEKTYMHFALQYKDTGIRYVEDSLGHTIMIIEEYENTAYFIPQDEPTRWESNANLAIQATDFNRNSVWVGAIGDNVGATAKAYRTRDDAILDFVETWGRRQFEELLEFATDEIPEETDILVERKYPEEQRKWLLSEPINFNAHSEDSLLGVVYFYSQEVMDKLFEMGYPQFRDGETLDQTRKRLFDYIKTNGFFCWKLDFSNKKSDPYYLKCFQVFEVELKKTPPEWYTEN